MASSGQRAGASLEMNSNLIALDEDLSDFQLFIQQLSAEEERHAREVDRIVQKFIRTRPDLPLNYFNELSRAPRAISRRLHKCTDSTDQKNLWKVSNVYSTAAVDSDKAMRALRTELRPIIGRATNGSVSSTASTSSASATAAPPRPRFKDGMKRVEKALSFSKEDMKDMKNKLMPKKRAPSPSPHSDFDRAVINPPETLKPSVPPSEKKGTVQSVQQAASTLRRKLFSEKKWASTAVDSPPSAPPRPALPEKARGLTKHASKDDSAITHNRDGSTMIRL